MDDVTPPRLNHVQIAVLHARIEQLARGDHGPGSERLMVGLDRELLSLADRYAALSPGEAGGAWIPVADALAKGLLGAIPEHRAFELCQVEVDGMVQRWDVGDEFLVCRVLVELPAGLTPSPSGRFLVSRASLAARVAAPASRAMGKDWFRDAFAPVPATAAEAASPRPLEREAPRRWVDVDGALAAAPAGASSTATLVGRMIRRAAKVIEEFGDRIAGAGWRSEHQVEEAPWVLRCLCDDPNTGLRSLVIHTMPWRDSAAAAGHETRAPAPEAAPPVPLAAPDPEESPVELEAMAIPGPVEE